MKGDVVVLVSLYGPVYIFEPVHVHAYEHVCTGVYRVFCRAMRWDGGSQGEREIVRATERDCARATHADANLRIHTHTDTPSHPHPYTHTRVYACAPHMHTQRRAQKIC